MLIKISEKEKKNAGCFIVFLSFLIAISSISYFEHPVTSVLIRHQVEVNIISSALTQHNVISWEYVEYTYVCKLQYRSPTTINKSGEKSSGAKPEKMRLEVF